MEYEGVHTFLENSDNFKYPPEVVGGVFDLFQTYMRVCEDYVKVCEEV